MRNEKSSEGWTISGERKDADLCDVEPREVLFKDVPFYQEIEKISSAHVFQDLS